MSRRIALLANPVAGRGRHERDLAAVTSRLRDAGLVVDRLAGQDAGDSARLARLALEGGVDGLVVCGGDGMVNIAAQALAGTRTPLGVVAMGTGNDTARTLGLPLRDPLAAADVIVSGRTRTIDLARCGDRYFVTVMAAGFDALVNQRADSMTWAKGRMRYSLAIAAVLRRFQPIHYTLELDGQTREVDAMLVSIGNGDSMGGGLKVTHGAEVDDGQLDVVLFTSVPRRELITTYPKLFTGGHTRHPAYERHRVKRVTVAAAGVVAYADGERLGELPLTVEVEPEALTVYA
ncbi:diacylglycerol kinase [Nocardioides sp. AN3]